jgi:hypothetical protein
MTTPRRPDLTAAATLLAAVLARENAALAALDLAGAAGMLAEKQRAAQALLDARPPANPAGTAPAAAVAGLASRLRALAEENRRLLERAITVQGRILGMIARAVPVSGQPRCYGATGALASGRRAAPFTLSARA